MRLRSEIDEIRETLLARQCQGVESVPTDQADRRAQEGAQRAAATCLNVARASVAHGVERNVREDEPWLTYVRARAVVLSVYDMRKIMAHLNMVEAEMEALRGIMNCQIRAVPIVVGEAG